jgi:hypothetical protein
MDWIGITGIIFGAMAALFSFLTYMKIIEKPILELYYSDKPAKNMTFWIDNQVEFELPLSIYNKGKKTINAAKDPFYMSIKLPNDLEPIAKACHYKVPKGMLHVMEPDLKPGEEEGLFYGWIKTNIFPKKSLKISQLYINSQETDCKIFEIKYFITWSSGEEEGVFYLRKDK